MTDLLFRHFEDINAARERIRLEIEERQSTKRRLDAASAAIGAIRNPYRPVVYGGTDAYRTMFVADHEIADGTLVRLVPVLVPHLVAAARWHKPYPNDSGGTTMRSTDIPVDEVVSTVRDAYADGVVRVADDLGDVQRAECPACAGDAMLYCDHWFDYEYDRQRVTLHRLCLRCPSTTEIAHVECTDNEPHPLLPPRHPPTPRRHRF